MSIFKDKIVIVTGGGQGIGEGIAKIFAEDGATVIITGRTASKLERVANELSEFNVIPYPMNVGFEEDWKKLIGFVKENYGHLDVLVNNAGIEMGKDIHAMSFEEFKLMQSCNVDGVFLGSKYAYEVLVKHGDASVINISSVSSKRSGPNCGNDAGYSASKAAVNLLTKHAAYTYAPDGIRVNAILPGGIRTPMVDESLKNVPNAEDYLKTINPLPPHLGKVEDIAHLVYFVASPENAYMTGAELVCDGGMITH